MKHQIELVVTPTGRWWLPADVRSDIVIRAIKAGQVFESAIVEEAARHIRPGTTVLDVGSNFGQMSVLFSRLVGPSGRVHAFEADPFVFDLLRRNIDENGCDNVVLHHGAVWHESGRTLRYPEPDFKRFGSFGSYGINPQARRGRRVVSLTIDSLGIVEPISFMKIDVQGSDLFALIGARNTIDRHGMPIVFEYEDDLQKEFKTSWAGYEKFIQSIGYTIAKTIDTINYVIVRRGATG